MNRHEEQRLRLLLSKLTRRETLSVKEAGEFFCLVVKAREAGLAVMKSSEYGVTDIYRALAEAARELDYDKD